MPPYILISDVVPAKTGGYGSQVLAWNWTQVVGGDLKLVVTHLQSTALSREQVVADLDAPVVFYPDLCRYHFRRRMLPLKSAAELVLGLWSLPRIVRQVRRSGGRRLFAFVSNSAWFLLLTDLVSRWTRTPLDYYLVDDLEASAALGRQQVQARLIRWIEPRLLRRADRVFAISPGYCEHLSTKYGLRASWLPVAVRELAPQYRPFRPSHPDVRCITFIGGVSALYAEGLRDCLALISEWNRGSPSFQLRLLLMTYTPPEQVRRQIGCSPDMELLIRPGAKEFDERLRSSWALFLPYSFAPSERVMVTCSFPTKLTDALLAGRPILVYGPSYASAPRYFLENDLPLCITARGELERGLRLIEQVDGETSVRRYEATVSAYHSAHHLRRVLAG